MGCRIVSGSTIRPKLLVDATAASGICPSQCEQRCPPKLPVTRRLRAILIAAPCDCADRGVTLYRRGPHPQPSVRLAVVKTCFRVPVKEIVDRRWIEDSSDVDVLEARVLNFYGIDITSRLPVIQGRGRAASPFPPPRY